jgi:methionine-S-sulfoxide reductase
MSDNQKFMTLGGGCFWCIEAIFNRLEGVELVESGYCGGNSSNATYEEVKTGESGHAEVCHISFNPSIISEAEILSVFFKIHDPTTLNRQGNDVGTQYRSSIFYHDQNQKSLALKIIEEVDKSNSYSNPVVTSVEEFKNYVKAEDYHQNYYENNKTENQYCSLVVKPKIDKFEKAFSKFLK